MRSDKLETCISTWWGEILISLISKDYFENKGVDILWGPSPAVSETELELLLYSRLQLIYKSHFMVVPWLMTFLWRKYMGE